MLLNVDYHLTDRCNLNCVSCGHFCSLVPKDTPHKSLDQIKSDLYLLYKATNFGQELNRLTLTGGEVTLHPYLSNIITLAYMYFPKKIRVWTNGILYKELIKIKDVIKTHEVELCMTIYNHTFSDKAYKELSNEFGNMLKVDRTMGNYTIFSRTFFSTNPFHFTEDEIKQCEPRQYCTQLKDGKLYPCQYLAYYKYLLDKFPDIKVPFKECFIDLNTVTSINEIEYFLKNVITDCCYYCVDCLPIAGYERPKQNWKQSELEKGEWILNN